MKHLKLSPPLLILTMGYPGSGKTFFARQFAEQYGLARISEDRIRFELFENPGFTDDEADIINSLQFYMVEETMQTESLIVVEGSFLRAKQRKEYYELAKKNGYQTLVVWLQTDIATSADRAANRDRRNPDSKYSFPVDESIVERMKKRLERPGERENAVVISGKHAFKAQMLTVLRKITNMYSAELKQQAQAAPRTLPPRTAPAERPLKRIIQ